MVKYKGAVSFSFYPVYHKGDYIMNKLTAALIISIVALLISVVSLILVLT